MFFTTNGTFRETIYAQNVKLDDVGGTKWLTLDWSETGSADRALNFKVNGADRTIDLSGNLTLTGANTVSTWTDSGLTATRLVIASTGGLLADDAALTYVSPALNIGTTTAGKNLIVNATQSAETITAPMVTGGWTLGFDTGGWAISAGVLSKTASTGTQTATAVSGMTLTPTAGRTYKVVIVSSAASGSTSYTLGGTSGTTISSATTTTDYIVAGTTAKIIFSGAAATTVTITSVSIVEFTDATGDVTVYGDTTSDRFLARRGTTAYPGISFSSNTGTGFYVANAATGQLAISVAGGLVGYLDANGLRVPALRMNLTAGDAILTYDASQTFAFRNSTAQQVVRFYNTYTDSSNYERLTLTGVAGASVNITAETAGTGGDNLDIVLTPAGTGRVKDVSSQITAGSGTGLTVVDAGHIGKSVYVVTVTYAGFSAAALTADHTIATLPAKTRLMAVYADTTTPFSGGTVSAASLTVGKSAGGVEYIATHDVKTAAVTKGLADADMGTELTAAARIQGSAVVNWTGTTTVSARLTTVTANTDQLTAGSVTFYLVTCRL